MLEVNSIAPDFCAPNQDDVEICLRDIKGSWIVLYFYPRDNTPGCTTEACDFTASMPEFDNLDATILGVSPDTPAKHRNFIEKQNLSITLLADVEKKMCEDYGVWQLKKFMGRESMGVVRTTFIINPKGEIAAVWEKVSVRKKKKVNGETIEILHVDEVKEKLQELQTK
ncbi:alkyl hydroperoxide reductase/ Thiol specific antioxidant/ Mal allergen [Arcobacter nitrofigilis DSM 7299]|uniref:Putative peroxiredoxin bcp n=1 Tax=Arcobacter nitrofigilis (strain ATCC 33309 / DSM 7299 / CCUG 15893 / LMG 7604 / NCTC 12251 / CI) TaxID=572480 RepID=D5V0Z3_ARCNC|nr:thioredoxin-dependent thiol peroxidase [Arcobacter nitrofigilis]ADG93955.1 alkyl hydroperoxide reductase/ Thiol specific antioxidant/ Mal allergen [Arcobacter nitrofigilis DSM 7299]